MRLLTIVLSLVLLAAPVGAASAVSSSPVVRTETQARPAPSEEGGISIRLLDVPVSTQNDPRAQNYIVDHVNPGITIERRVEIENTTNSIQEVRLYPGAAAVEDGNFTFQGEGVENELTTWTSVSESEVELAAGEKAEVLVAIEVPSGASEAEQYGVVWAEVSSSAKGGKTVQASRVGVRIYLSVGPGNGPSAAFEVDSLTAGRDSEGRPEVTAEVNNIGGRAVDITGTLALQDGPGGISAGPFAVVRGTTIAPGETAPVSVALDSELPDGPWDTTLTLKSGLLSEQATATLQFPEAGQSTEVEPDRSLGLLWLAVLGAALVLIAVAALLWVVHRRKTIQA